MIHLKQLIFISLITFFVGCAHIPPNQFNTNETKENNIYDIHKSVVILYVSDQNNNAKFFATGFAYDKDRIVTAGHFCIEALKYKVSHKYTVDATQNIDGVIKKLNNLSIEKVSETADVCLLNSKGHKLTPLKMLKDTIKLKYRDKVTIVGAPISAVVGYFEGDILSKYYSGFGPISVQGLIIVSAPSTGGISGSPIILNSTGEVIGVLIAGHETFDHFSVGVPISEVIKLAK